MRAAKVIAVVLVFAFSIASSHAASRRDNGDCTNASDPARRVAACTRVLESETQPKSRAILFYNRARALDDQNDLDRAISDFNEAIRLDSSDPDFYDSRATVWKKKGESDKAIADFSEAISRAPKKSDFLNNRGMVWYDKENFQKASADFEDAIRLSPRESAYYFNLGQSEFKQKNYDRAIADFDAAIRLNRKDGDYFSWRGRARQSKTNFREANEDFTEAIRLDPKNKEYYFRRASNIEETGDTDRAIADYSEVIRLDPEYVRAYSQRGLQWLAKGDFDRALSDQNEALKINPKSNPAYHNRALVWRSRNDWDRAIADLTEAIRINPKESLHYAVRGDTYRLKGDLQSALNDQNKAVELSPGSPTAYGTRGDTLRYMGEYARALADYDTSISLSNTDSLPSFVGRGLTFEKMGDLTRARQEFEKVLSSKTQVKGEFFAAAIETARARLAALNSGAIQPVIPVTPRKAESETSIPTAVVAVPAAQPATPEQGRRIALVIGNSAYKNVSALANPQRDADKIAQSLRAIGFTSVTLVNDAGRDKLTDALRAFAKESESADWAVVYYAGHGIEVNGTNYLIPVDARIVADGDVQSDAVPLDQVTASAEGAKKLKLILLDACRDNPFAPQIQSVPNPALASAAGPIASRSTATRSIGRGLGEVKVSGATLVVYAAKHGQTALDGEGGNSPFAIAVVQRIATPNVEINKLFRLVRDDVMEATAGRQEPYTYGSLPGREDFFFVQR